METGPRQLFVIGATGSVGTATVKALSAMVEGTDVIVKAGCRNPSKATELAALPNVEVVKAEMGAEDLESTIAGVDCLFIVSPTTSDRAVISLKTLASAERAGVKHVLVLSVLTAELPSIFGTQQMAHLEAGAKLLGVPYTVIRLPPFLENYISYQGSIASDNAIYGPMDGSKMYTPAAVADIGKAAATIMMDPSVHVGQTYNILSDRHSMADVASAFSSVLGKEISYVRVPYEAAKESLLEVGLPEWQVDGIMQMYKYIDNDDPIYSTPSDFEAITGEKPIDLTTYVTSIAPMFA